VLSSQPSVGECAHAFVLGSAFLALCLRSFKPLGIYIEQSVLVF
jgi:hypothetical protein